MNLPSAEKYFERTCRTCLLKSIQNSGDQMDLQSIYEFRPEYPTMHIAEMLANSIPQLFIQKNDDLPKTICTICIKKLLKVQQFQQMCIESDAEMRSVLDYGAQESKFSQVHEEPATPALFEMSTENHMDPLQEATTFLKIEMNDNEYENSGISNQQESIAIDDNSSVKAGKSEREVSLSASCSLHSDNDDEDWDEEEDSVGGKPKKRRKQPILQLKKKLCVQENDDYAETTNSKDTRVRNSKELSCAECGKVFKNNYRLNRHMKVHSALEKQFVCPHCKYRFTTAPHLRRHVANLHTNAKEEELNSLENNKACGDFLSENNQTVGDVLNGLEKDLECDVCRKTFKTPQLAIRHKRRSHKNMIQEQDSQDIQKPYICKYCNKAFQQSCTLKDHIRTHTGEQPYLCSECGKAFNSSSNMKQHLLRHTGIKRYECSDCPKKFPCLSDLASHRAVHKKIKPHVCDVCGAAFGKPYQLKKHKMYHNGDKPHKCEYCEMRFVCADHMRRHMRTHTGEKPYKCKYCERAFAQSNDLIKHLRSHLGENVYKCELCPRGFRMATEMREHFAEHKDDDEETRQMNLQALMEEEVKLRINMPVHQHNPPMQINDVICN